MRPRREGALIAAGALVLVAASVVGPVQARLQRASTHQDGPSPSSAISTVRRQADGCAALTFGLQRLTANSQTLATATGQLTGNVRTVDGMRYTQMRLTKLHAIAGAPLPVTATVWLQSEPNPDPANVPGLWSPDGKLITVITPQNVTKTLVGPMARVAPILGNRVVLNSAGCWFDTSLHAEPLTGRSFQEVPGTTAYDLAAKFGGFSTVPITILAHAAH